MSTSEIAYEALGRNEHRPALDLLATEGLPTEDLTPERVHLIGARVQGELVGCIGLEGGGRLGLVRSLAVAPPFRGRGIAHALYERLLEEVRRRELRELFLLTATAEAFFARLGFVPVDRERVPEEIRETREFASLCPASTTVMKRTMP